MRIMSLLIAGTVLASCTAAPPPPTGPSPAAQMQLARAIQGKVPQAPISCLPNYKANDQTTIDGRTLAFRVGSATTYIVHLSPGCEMINGGSYALVSRQFGGGGLCKGDIQSVVDTASHFNVGSCTIDEIVPYVRR
jgi:hypothetical protein